MANNTALTLPAINTVKWNAMSIEARAIAESCLIESDDDECKVAESLAVIKKYATQAEDERKRLIGPFSEMVRRINAVFKPFLSSFEDAEKTLKAKIIAWHKHKEQVRRELEEKREKEYEEQLKQARENPLELEVECVPVPLPTLPAARTVRTARGSATITKRWKGEVVDMNAFLLAVVYGKISAGLIAVNQAGLNEFAREIKQECTLHGVKIFQEEVVSNRIF